MIPYQEVNGNPRNQEEMKAWLQELESFDFPEYSHPPVDAWDLAICEYKRRREMHQRDSVEPNEYYSFQVICHAFFAWLLSKEGSLWLLELFGIEEVAPHHGYRYWFGGAGHTTGAQLIGDETDSSLRIFIKKQANRFMEPPSETPGTIAQMKNILFKMYKYRDKRAPMYPTEGMWKWVLGALRNWFTEPVDKQWPFPKSDRINGMQWAKQFKDPWSPTAPMWNVISMMDTYFPRVYRVEQRGGVLWCGRTKIFPQPRDIFDAKEGRKAIARGDLNISTERLYEKIQKHYTCDSCGRVLCCVDDPVVHSSRDRSESLCDNCFGIQVESGDRETLDNCTYSECYECPNFIRSSDDLKNLKSRMGQQYRWPVQR